MLLNVARRGQGANVAKIDDALEVALNSLEAKPDENASQAAKKRYSELLSQKLALVLGAELRARGLRGKAR